MGVTLRLALAPTLADRLGRGQAQSPFGYRSPTSASPPRSYARTRSRTIRSGSRRHRYHGASVRAIVRSADRRRQRLNRLIQATCADACNDEGWVIPFTQITLHTASRHAPGVAERLGCQDTDVRAEAGGETMDRTSELKSRIEAKRKQLEADLAKARPMRRVR